MLLANCNCYEAIKQNSFRKSRNSKNTMCRHTHFAFSRCMFFWPQGVQNSKKKQGDSTPGDKLCPCGRSFSPNLMLVHTLVLAWMGAPWSKRISAIRTCPFLEAQCNGVSSSCQNTKCRQYEGQWSKEGKHKSLEATIAPWMCCSTAAPLNIPIKQCPPLWEYPILKGTREFQQAITQWFSYFSVP